LKALPNEAEGGISPIASEDYDLCCLEFLGLIVNTYEALQSSGGEKNNTGRRVVWLKSRVGTIETVQGCQGEKIENLALEFVVPIKFLDSPEAKYAKRLGTNAAGPAPLLTAFRHIQWALSTTKRANELRALPLHI
jgi:hypothetical protein